MSLHLTATLEANTVLGRSLTLLVDKVLEGERAARKTAAAIATEKTRESFEYKRPFDAPERPGRWDTGGHFTESLRWVPETDAFGGVKFDTRYADEHVPQWIIMEIGTGERATLRNGMAANPQGRPGAGATYVRSVKSQRGRVIPFSLAWGTGPSGEYTPPAAAEGQQLYLRSQLLGAPLGMSYEPRQMHITKEIKGQRFVNAGSIAGFRDYRTSVLAAARRHFAASGHARPGS